MDRKWRFYTNSIFGCLRMFWCDKNIVSVKWLKQTCMLIISCDIWTYFGAKFKHELEWLGAHILSYYFVTLFSYSGTFVHCKSALKWMGEVVWEGAGMISHSVVHRSSAQVVMCSCSLHHHSAASTGTKYSTISTYPHTQCQARGTHTFQLHTYYNCLCNS